jgi:hypothetical protein
MEFTLAPHPATPPPVPLRVSARVRASGAGALSIAYRIDGATDRIALPALARPQRADGLWRQSCFELFLAPSPATGYLEFNFSPSSQWAAYAFDDYRIGMRPLPIAAPQITVERQPGTLIVSVALHCREAVCGATFSLAAVLAFDTAPHSFWALAHAPDKPDFHRRDCFTGRIGAAGDA